MKNPIIAIGLIMAASTATAVAAEMTDTVKAIDKKHDSITLSDGKTLALPEGIEAETLKVGEKIAVVYSSKGGKLFATSIHAVK